MAIYLYCAIPYEEGKNFDFPERGVYSLHYKGITAVVSDVQTIEPPLTEDTTEQHDVVVREVMKKHIVVPAAFGMALKNKEILKAILKRFHSTIKETFKSLQNKIELGVKVILKTNDKTIDINECKKEIENLLSENAIKTVKGRLFSDRLLLNKSFLVEKDKIENFSAQVAELEKKYPQFKFQYSGPWPPYSFVNIRIHGR